MNSWSVRASSLITLAATVLAVLCAAASFTDTRHHALPLVNLQILKFGPLERLWNGDDKVIMLLNVTADLESVFTWNTKQEPFLENVLSLPNSIELDKIQFFDQKHIAIIENCLFVFVAAEYSSPDTGFNQIVVWDTIIERKEDAKIEEQVITNEKLSEKSTRDGPCAHSFEGKNLLGREFNLTMSWNLMPFSGTFLMNKVVVLGFQLPQQYS